MNQVKMVVVIRADTQPPMRKGKAAAQAVHAALGFLVKRISDASLKLPEVSMHYGDFYFYEFMGLTPPVRQWLEDKHRRVIVLKAETEGHLQEIWQQAQTVDLETTLVTDAGFTEFVGPTRTCLAVGPDYDEKIDPITGFLKPF